MKQDNKFSLYLLASYFLILESMYFCKVLLDPLVLMVKHNESKRGDEMAQCLCE